MDKPPPHIIWLCIGQYSLLGIQLLKACRKDPTLKIDRIILADDRRWDLFDHQLNPRAERTWRRFWKTKLRRYRWRYRLRQEIRKSNVPAQYVHSVNTASFIQQTRERGVDIILTAAWPQIFGSQILTTCRQGIIGIHPSLLPAYAGAHPHFWVIRKGEPESGVTTHWLTEKIDQGPLVAQVRFSIAGLRYREVYKKIGKSLPELVQKTQQVALHGGAPMLENQDQHPSRFKNNQDQDSAIDFQRQDAYEIKQIILCESGFFWWKGRRLHIIRGDIEPRNSQEAPGTVLEMSARGGVLVQCKSACIRLKQVNHHYRKQAIFPLVQKLGWRKNIQLPPNPLYAE